MSTSAPCPAEIGWTDWQGPRPSHLENSDGFVLKKPVPPRYWPHGPPSAHGANCELRKPGGLYCSCRLASEPGFDARDDEPPDEFGRIVLEPGIADEYLAGGASWWWELGSEHADPVTGTMTRIKVIRRRNDDNTYVCKVPLVTPLPGS